MTVLTFSHLTKRFGAILAVDDLTVEVAPGRITAFLGANGSGKTTTMRMLLGLAEPTSGTATIDGVAYRDLPRPLATIGAVIDAGLHPNRTARNHLRVVAAQAGAPAERVDEVLALVDLGSAAARRVGGFSLGMRQRLALAAAIVGDPSVLVLDEPFNGLDPLGITAMRTFLRGFADRGGTVFLSSHLLAEVKRSADDAVIIHRGRLVSAGPVATLGTADPAIVVSTADAGLLAVCLAKRDARVERTGPEELTVRGVSREAVGRAAVDVGAPILGMRVLDDDLESVFAQLISAQETS
jgi:ABC-2 type transport system ATP-binding protein